MVPTLSVLPRLAKPVVARPDLERVDCTTHTAIMLLDGMREPMADIVKPIGESGAAASAGSARMGTAIAALSANPPERRLVAVLDDVDDRSVPQVAALPHTSGAQLEEADR